MLAEILIGLAVLGVLVSIYFAIAIYRFNKSR